MTDREIQVAFGDHDIYDAYNKLKEGKGEEQILYGLIENAISHLRQDPQCGTKIQKHIIPEIYRTKFDVENLYKYNLNENWRLVYTITGDKLVIVTVILEWMDHKNYERRFGF